MGTKCERCGYDLTGLHAVNGSKLCPECGRWNRPGRRGGRRINPELRAILIGAGPTLVVLAGFVLLAWIDPRWSSTMESIANGMLFCFYLSAAIFPWVAFFLYRRVPFYDRPWRIGIPVLLWSYGAIAIATLGVLVIVLKSIAKGIFNTM